MNRLLFLFCLGTIFFIPLQAMQSSSQNLPGNGEHVALPSGSVIDLTMDDAETEIINNQEQTGANTTNENITIELLHKKNAPKNPELTKFKMSIACLCKSGTLTSIPYLRANIHENSAFLEFALCGIPLCKAVAHNNLIMARFLLELGNDPNTKIALKLNRRKREISALDLARELNRRDMIELLNKFRKSNPVVINPQPPPRNSIPTAQPSTQRNSAPAAQPSEQNSVPAAQPSTRQNSPPAAQPPDANSADEQSFRASQSALAALLTSRSAKAGRFINPSATLDQAPRFAQMLNQSPGANEVFALREARAYIFHREKRCATENDIFLMIAGHLPTIKNVVGQLNVDDKKTVINITFSALDLAMLRKDMGQVQFLLECGSVLDNPLTGRLPLQGAIRMQNLELVELLLRYNAPVNMQERLGNNQTPLMALLALHEKQRKPAFEKIFAILMERADLELNVQDDNGDTALHHAINQQLLLCTKKIIHKGSPLNTKNNQGLTPLMVAAKNDFRVIVSELIKAGSDITSEDDNNQSFYHYLPESTRSILAAHLTRGHLV